MRDEGENERQPASSASVAVAALSRTFKMAADLIPLICFHFFRDRDRERKRGSLATAVDQITIRAHKQRPSFSSLLFPQDQNEEKRKKVKGRAHSSAHPFLDSKGKTVRVSAIRERWLAD